MVKLRPDPEVEARAAYAEAVDERAFAHKELMLAATRGAREAEMRPWQRMLDAARQAQQQFRPVVTAAATPTTSGIALKFPVRRKG